MAPRPLDDTYEVRALDETQEAPAVARPAQRRPAAGDAPNPAGAVV